MIRSDLPAVQKKSVRDAIKLLWELHVEGRGGKTNKKDDEEEESASAEKKRASNHKENVKKSDKWADFARALKASLDKHCKPHWHVFVGCSLGFACKKRNETMAIFRVGEESGPCTVIVYQSPGIEIPSSLDRAPQPQAFGDRRENEEIPEGEEDAAAEERPEEVKEEEKPTPLFRVLEPPTGDVAEESEVARVIDTVREVAQANADATAQSLATSLRAGLMAAHGPIWHVIAGSEFASDVAVDRRNYVLATVGTGKSAKRMLVFQHEQFVEAVFDWKRLLNALPYLLIVLFMMSVLTTSALCDQPPVGEALAEADAAGHALSAPAPKELTWFQQQVCGDQSEKRLYTFGACAVALMVFLKGKRMSKMAGMRKAGGL